MLKRYVVGLIIVWLSTACSRKADPQSSISFKLPPHPDVSAKGTNQAFSGSKFCYFVNVTGSGITQTPNNCAPTDGVNTGFVEPLTQVELTVAQGSSRTVEVFGYLPPDGVSCSGAGASLSSVPLNRLFLMGKKTGVTASGASTPVDIKIIFPGIRNHYGLQAGMASGCYANLPAIPDPMLGASSPLQVGSVYRIISKVSSGAASPQTAAGSSYSIQGSVTHVAQ